MKFSYPHVLYESEPFAHAVVKGAWDDHLIRACKEHIATFTDWSGLKMAGMCQHKRHSSNPTGPCLELIEEANSPKFIRWLEKLTGETELVADPKLIGGGIHSISRGGFLKLHVDFNIHKDCGYRRLNVLVYLNHDWQWNGELELAQHDADAPVKKVPPLANTMVVFTTDDNSIHGHPEPLDCPADVTRDSIALYYYSKTKPASGWASERKNTLYYP